MTAGGARFAALATVLLLWAAPLASAQKTPPRPEDEGDLRLAVTSALHDGSLRIACEASGPLEPLCVVGPAVGTVRTPPAREAEGPVESGLLTPLLSLLERIDPFPVASATGARPAPESVTLELRVHWGGAREGSWVQACVFVDDEAPACARSPLVNPAPEWDPATFFLLVDALRSQVPAGAPPPGFPVDADAARALDAVLAALPGVDVDPPSAAPEPAEPGDLEGATTFLVPADGSGPSASSTWNASGGLGEWSAIIVMPFADDIRPAPRDEAPRADAPTLRAAGPAPEPFGRAKAPLLPQASKPRASEPATATEAGSAGAGGVTEAGVRKDAAPAALASQAGLVLGSVLAMVLAAAVALFARLRKDRLAAQPTRERLLAALHERPGLTAGDLARALHVHKGTVRYHLRVLSRAGFVVTRGSKGRAYHFLAGTPAPLLLAGAPRAVYDAVAARPGANVRDLCALTRSHRTTIHYHVRALRDAGLLTVERHGRRLRLYARPVAA